MALGNTAWRLENPGETGVKTQGASGPFPFRRPLVSTRRLARSGVSEPYARGEGGNGLVSRVANPRARGASEEAPELGRPGAAGFPRQSTNAGRLAPEACTAASLSLPRAAAEGPAVPSRCWPVPESAPQRRRQPAPPEHRTPRATRTPQTPVL
ncbi:hypothetical protein LEMLEM_LOCUS16193 [Lemmus lemmus]